MLNDIEKEKMLEKHMLLTLFDGPELQRGEPTKRLHECYAAVPLAQAFAEKCGGILSHVSFGKFVGNIGIKIHGGMEAMNRELEEFRLLVDAADDIDVFTCGDEVEATFIFWDIYEINDIREKRKLTVKTQSSVGRKTVQQMSI